MSLFCIFVLFFCADGRARARLPRQRANRVPARQQREQQKVGADSALSVRASGFQVRSESL